MTTTSIFRFPSRNNSRSIEDHQTAVLAALGPLFQEIDDALTLALPKALSIFGLYDGPVDLAVHAPNTRYLVKQHLSKQSAVLHEEDEVFFNMKRVSNCGLCVRTKRVEIRILKAPQEGLPKALSDARIGFSSSNQLVFSFAEDDPTEVPSLNLFALWTMDNEHRYLGLQVACPREVRTDGTVECYWIASWKAAKHPSVATVQSEAPDLDEITAVVATKAKKS